MLTPELSYFVLLVVQAAHLLHHRLARRHISFAEVTSGALLLVPLSALPAAVLITAHLTMSAIQVVGSIFIKRLSPDWNAGPGLLARLG